jgi:putative FmdB family regulatory protein
VPLYEYKCTKCNRRTEKIEPVNGPHLKKCPHCGGKVESLISAPAIQFKGSGWYVTDYAGKSPAGESAKDEKPSSDKKDSKDSKDSSSKDSSSKDSSSKDSSAKESKKEKPAKK